MLCVEHFYKPVNIPTTNNTASFYRKLFNIFLLDIEYWNMANNNEGRLRAIKIEGETNNA